MDGSFNNQFLHQIDALTRAPSGVGESAPGPGVSWGGNSGCHLAQPHICGHATIPCPTIYVDTTPTQPTPILSIQRPAHSAPALSLCARGWGPRLPEARHQDDRGGGDDNGDDYNYDGEHHHLGWFSMIMIITIILWALFARGWRAPRRLPPYGEPTPGQLFHTLPNNLLFLSAFHWLLDGLKKKQNNFVSFLVLLTMFRIGFNTFCGMMHWVIFFLQIFILLKRIAFHML